MLTYVSVALRATACIGTIVSMLFVQHAHAQLRFDNWHEEAELEAIYADFQRAEPSIVRIVDIGESERGLPIRAIKISDNVGNDEPDEGDVVFFGLMHAREWISMEMSLFLADHLIQNYRSDPAIRRYVDELEIWIVPVTNPDGFAFTQSDSPIPTSNRMPPRFWRKNQKRNDDGTVGVDLNRNWPSFWGRDSGSSAMPVADTYRGTEPFSEAETTSLVRFTDSLD
ncbi:MAG: M14 family zinc carboxypeptidase, partial [Pseudomonadota bacterium]